MLLKSVILIFFGSPLVHGANILAIVPSASYSHQIAYLQLWKELSLRGHKVTLITADPLKDPNLTNLTEIDLHHTYDDIKKGNQNITKIIEEWDMWKINSIIMDFMDKLTDIHFNIPGIKDLITNHKQKHFDVVLVEFLWQSYLAFAELYKAPLIVIASLDAYDLIHHAVGNPSHPILNPDMMTPFYGKLTFCERVESTIYSWYQWYFRNFVMVPAAQKLAEKHFGNSVSIRRNLNNIDMLFLNVHPVIQGARAVGPTTINVAYRRNVIQPKPLPKDLKEFLDSAKEGFIYFSLGSNVKSNLLKEEILQTIKNALGELPIKVLWKFESDVLPGKPNNVKIVKWTPQIDVLRHPNIKLFVTQGGLQSMEESILNEVPFVVMPFFGDQEQNAKLMEIRKIAKFVDRKTLSKDNLQSAILEVLNNPDYYKNVKKLKQLALDTPMSGLDLAIWWTEYVIRNNGTKHLRNPSADIPLYQYLLLDVLGFIISMVFISFVILIFVIKNITRIISKFSNSRILSKKHV